jgi:spore coat protein U-like protein
MRTIARLLLAGLLSSPGVASAINCSVTVPPFVFGAYQPASFTPLDVNGQINVRCTGTAGAFLARLSTGGSGTFVQRQMRFSTYLMSYNFYTDAARTTIWGDGSGGTSFSGGVKLNNGLRNFVLPVYGRVFARQNVGAGGYTDNVIVTISF